MLIAICAGASIGCLAVCVKAYRGAKWARQREEDVRRDTLLERNKQVYCTNCRHGLIMRETNQRGRYISGIACAKDPPCEGFERVSAESDQDRGNE